MSSISLQNTDYPIIFKPAKLGAKKENEKLKVIIERYFGKHGDYDWKAIAKKANKTPYLCKKQWNRTINPEIKKGKWSKKEDQRLLKRVEKCGSENWKRIAKKMRGRTRDQCQERYMRYLDPSIKFSDWTKSEDRELAKAVAEIGEGHWKAISQFLPGRTGKQCDYHWRKIVAQSDDESIEARGTKRKRESEEDSLSNEVEHPVKASRTEVIAQELSEDDSLYYYVEALLKLSLKAIVSVPSE